MHTTCAYVLVTSVTEWSQANTMSTSPQICWNVYPCPTTYVTKPAGKYKLGFTLPLARSRSVIETPSATWPRLMQTRRDWLDRLQPDSNKYRTAEKTSPRHNAIDLMVRSSLWFSLKRQIELVCLIGTR